MLHVEIDWSGVEVHCICAHLGLFEGSRQRQVEAMIARINEHVPADAPLIIAGDFNDWRVRLGPTLRDKLGVCEFFDQDDTDDGIVRTPAQVFKRRVQRGIERGLGMQAQPARTFPSAFPILRLDRVYVRGFKVRKANVMHGLAWRKLSDHAPIVVDLDLDPGLARSAKRGS
jgi:endonuclease/exonuclease/phosphatase family metal-dependent hydrolase